MKNILILLALLLLNKTNAQDKVIYTASMIELVIVENGEIATRKPKGKNVKIEFDKFLKSYYVTYNDEQGAKVFFNLSYLTGETFNNENVWRMYDQNNNYFLIADQLKTKNRLVITLEVKLEGNMKAHYWITNAKLE